MAEEGNCTVHGQPFQFVCTYETCTDRRTLCQTCVDKDHKHFMTHGNFIYKLKNLRENMLFKKVLPAFERSIRDCEQSVKEHRSFHQAQLARIDKDFQALASLLQSHLHAFKKEFVRPFEEQVVVFDHDLSALTNQLQEYSNEEQQNTSFFSKLFGFKAEDKPADIESFVKKNSAAFKLRADLIFFKDQLSSAAKNRVLYASTPPDEQHLEALTKKIEQDLLHTLHLFPEVLSNATAKTDLKKTTQDFNVASSPSITTSEIIKPIDKKDLPRVPWPELPIELVERLKQRRAKFKIPQLPVEGPFKYPEGIYYGNYNGNKREGWGSFYFEQSKSIYEGFWENDIISKMGILIRPDALYEGEISHGLASGNGFYEDATRVYKGEWRSDRRHGRGQETLKTSKVRYKGGFTYNQYHGLGCLEDDELIYEGWFKDGKFQGEGKIQYKNGDSFVGVFKEGNRVQGKFVFVDGSQYEGEFKNNVPHGQGEFLWADGIRYRGEWSNGLQDGAGFECLKDGKQYKGLWQGGYWVKWL